jgi:hypothetical protein
LVRALGDGGSGGKTVGEALKVVIGGKNYYDGD